MKYVQYGDNGETSVTVGHLAAYFGLLTPMVYMIQRGHDINSKNQSSRTPLSYTAQEGYESVVKLLLDENANMESKRRMAGHRCCAQ